MIGMGTPISQSSAPFPKPISMSSLVGALADSDKNVRRSQGFRRPSLAGRIFRRRDRNDAFWNRMASTSFIRCVKEVTMDWNRVEGNWKQLKGAVKQQWGKLTDDDLTAIDGQREKLEGAIQNRYGIAKDETRKQIDGWYQRQNWQ
jgi:uncharacterized protein YjbJ (UPF0337 family)